MIHPEVSKGTRKEQLIWSDGYNSRVGDSSNKTSLLLSFRINSFSTSSTTTK
jgi:hypothetical protein